MTYWRELPSMVSVRDAAGAVTKSQLPPRFMEAVDEAAMRLGDTSSEAYLDGWRRGEWTAADGSPDDVVGAVVADLDARWDQAAIAAYLDGLGNRT